MKIILHLMELLKITYFNHGTDIQIEYLQKEFWKKQFDEKKKKKELNYNGNLKWRVFAFAIQAQLLVVKGCKGFCAAPCYASDCNFTKLRLESYHA